MKAIELFLREKICETLAEIKVINNKKIDRDIELFSTNIDLEEIIDEKNNFEFEQELLELKNKLTILIMCAKTGYEVLINDEFLEKVKNNASESEYNSFKEIADKLKELLKIASNVDVEDKTGEVN